MRRGFGETMLSAEERARRYSHKAPRPGRPRGRKIRDAESDMQCVVVVAGKPFAGKSAGSTYKAQQQAFDFASDLAKSKGHAVLVEQACEGTFLGIAARTRSILGACTPDGCEKYKPSDPRTQTSFAGLRRKRRRR